MGAGEEEGEEQGVFIDSLAEGTSHSNADMYFIALIKKRKRRQKLLSSHRCGFVKPLGAGRTRHSASEMFLLETAAGEQLDR